MHIYLAIKGFVLNYRGRENFFLFSQQIISKISNDCLGGTHSQKAKIFNEFILEIHKKWIFMCRGVTMREEKPYYTFGVTQPVKKWK